MYIARSYKVKHFLPVEEIRGIEINTTAINMMLERKSNLVVNHLIVAK